MVTMATQMPFVVAPLRNEIVSHFAKVVVDADDNSPGPYIAGGRRGQLPPPGKLNVFFLT